MRYKIIGINKDNGNHQNPHEAVRAYIYDGGNGKKYYHLRPKIVALMKSGATAYAHSDHYGDAECEVRSNGRIEFLQTIADGQYTNNLLALPEYNINE